MLILFFICSIVIVMNIYDHIIRIDKRTQAENEDLRKQIANLNIRIISLEDKCGDDGR